MPHKETPISSSDISEVKNCHWKLFIRLATDKAVQNLGKRWLLKPLPLFWQYLFSKKFYETFLVQNLGHNHLKKCNICCLGGLLKEKRESTSDLFSTFQKPYWPSCPVVHWCIIWKYSQEQILLNPSACSYQQQTDKCKTRSQEQQQFWNSL